jgi:hypothetical protein
MKSVNAKTYFVICVILLSLLLSIEFLLHRHHNSGKIFTFQSFEYRKCQNDIRVWFVFSEFYDKVMLFYF